MSTDPLPSWSELLALVERLASSDFEDFVVEMPGLTVRVSRRGLVEAAAPDDAIPEPIGSEPAADVTAVPLDGTEVIAPIVGLFFRRPAPDQPPFVEVGDDVAVGVTMAIIEVMKMMVPVEATVAGRVVAVLVEDGNLVESDQPLFVVDTSDVL